MDYVKGSGTRLLLKQESGFTLIEVLMAILILTLGILAYGKTSAKVMGTNNLSKKESIAVTLAQDRIEEFKNTGCCSVGSGTETVDVEGNASAPYTQYTRSWEITSPSESLYDLSVTVSWKDMASRSVTLNTRITK